jgi:hypothetical protein
MSKLMYEHIFGYYAVRFRHNPLRKFAVDGPQDEIERVLRDYKNNENYLARRASGHNKWLSVYTDGGMRNGQAGYGLAIPSLNFFEYGRVVGDQSSMGGEAYALLRMERLCKPFKLVTYYTDNNSMIELLRKLRSCSPERIRRIPYRDALIDFINGNNAAHGKNGWRVLHVSAHSVFHGNNLADSMATLGLNAPAWMSPFIGIDQASWPDTYTVFLNGIPVVK